ncbi:6873_t:CDS:1 [Cetraspora pellucida]|uniref:6873_t:CDS:1 n=1 Tax=Cetraspora pellucida TaxID=1433469 RepID=A0A9N8ZU69_9GLOM|nr:6873_t:CDS:1 [Cetraspora pellucida]
MYIEHFISSIPSQHPVLLTLNDYKNHINYTSINFCYKNKILLYTFPPHMTHILQSSKLPFSKLKAEYNKVCNKLHSESSELVTKHTFIKMFDLAYIKTYTSNMIINPNTINSDHLTSSIYTEQINVLSSFQSTDQKLLSNAILSSS